MSPEGIRYRSCKNGIVSEVTTGFDENDKTYIRFPVEMPDDSFETIYDVTEVALADGHDVSLDWTEVMLFGEDESQDTVAEPAGKEKAVARSHIAMQIFRRFAEFQSGAEVRISTIVAFLIDF